MISVTQALDALFALVRPMGIETVTLTKALGRTLAQPVAARRDQPPFAASAMDGYAVCEDTPTLGESWQIIGESAAGHGYSGAEIKPGQAIRIFTGAPTPDECKRVIMQEDVARSSSTITLTGAVSNNRNIRPAAADFAIGDQLSAPRVLSPSDLALLAAMNIAELPVRKRPVVALIATGDELVSPGETPGPDQIIASNNYGLHGLLKACGAKPRLLPIARDTMSSLETAFQLATDADLIITIGGASVGDHDLVAKAAADAGMQQSFYKVAMRPGKPLMAGRIGDTPLIGLPGNPVSAMVCGHVFLIPFVRAMLGHPALPVARQLAQLAAPIAANGPREHYLRARIDADGVTAFPKQDSSLLTVLSEANCLLVQAPNDPPHKAGDMVEIIQI